MISIIRGWREEIRRGSSIQVKKGISEIVLCLAMERGLIPILAANVR